MVEISSTGDSKSQSKDVKGEVRKFTWRIENFSSIEDQEIYSENFMVDGNKWQILIVLEGDQENYLSIYLEVSDSETQLPPGWSRYAQFGLAVIDQLDHRNSTTKVTAFEFKEGSVCRGFPSFLALSELHNPERGYLVDDGCLVEAYVSSDRSRGLISHEMIVGTDSDDHKVKEADCVEAVIDNQKTTITKSVEIIASPTQFSSQIVVIEPEEPTEEDMNTFFTSLESELSGYNIVYSQEDAKEAVAKLDEALNMTPVKLYDSGKFSSLKQAFKILARFYCSSTTLSTEKKIELLAMEPRFKELVDRGAKAVQDKNLLTAKESIKLAVTRDLDRNLIKFNQVKQELVALHEQVDEVRKKRENMLAEQKGIFRSCRKLKMELETLGKEWAEYEANAKVAEEEEKTVEAEWKRMKDFISSIKGEI